jgi:lipopolysaccharide/colanic/teichoic acid biosynthesis glycosyltransferase
MATDGGDVTDGYRGLKRALDVTASALGLCALSPAMGVIALAVKLDSPGPILFRQERVAFRGGRFTILKFRTMAASARGPAVTAGTDTRVTRVGRFLRRYKLDELPQLWNVLVGDMSLVGPRPEVERFVRLFPVEYARILTVRPGLTDFAALEYRDEEATLSAWVDVEAAYTQVVLPAKIALYHRYLAEMSLRTDASLVLRTIAAIFR